MNTRKMALCAAAAWCALGAGMALAQQASPADRQADRPRSSMTTNLPAQNEAQLRAKHPELYVLPPVSKAYQPAKTAWEIQTCAACGRPIPSAACHCSGRPRWASGCS